MADKDRDGAGYLLPDGVYQALKWVGLICLPALATFYGVCAPLWGWPEPAAVVATINALGVLLGALVGYSAATATPGRGDGGEEAGDGVD